MKKTLVIHDSDPDGFGAAWALHHRFGDDAEYVKYVHGVKYFLEDIDKDMAGRDVYVVDLSFDRDTVIKMHDIANSFTIIDHHRSAEKELAGLDYCHIDTSKSAAILTWEYFFPNCSPPLLIQYIQDWDLWTKHMPYIEEVNAVITSYEFNFDNYYHMSNYMMRHFDNFVREGEAILRFKRQCIKATLENCTVPTVIDGKEVLSVNSFLFRSELGHELAKNNKFGAVWFETNDKVQVSLRSSEDHSDDWEDVGDICVARGGGGHRHAAGFSFPIKESRIYESEGKSSS